MKLTDLAIVAALTGGLLLCAHESRAEEFDRPVNAGTIHGVIRAPAAREGTPATQSVSLKREDTGVRVLCLAALNDELVEGDTILIDREDAGVVLYAFAYPEPDCGGEASAPSFHAYRIIFFTPDRPILVVE